MASGSDESEKAKGSENVRAVDRALDILLAFTRHDAELGAAQLLQRVDLSRPTLYRLLHTLEKKGFVASSGDPQRFRLGPAVGRLSHAWTEALDLKSVAMPVLQSLWGATQETVAVFVPQGDMRFCLAELPSPQALNFKRGAGYTERIARGATGRAILAHSQPTDADLARYTLGLDIRPDKLKRSLAQTRAHGYAVSRDELIEGAVAVAAPFHGPAGVAGSIGIFGPATRLDGARVEQLAAMVMAAANQLSMQLGAGTVAGPSGA
ncbi:MAG: IclR family transcriptional regulator [Comamonadaceae bacterium]|nr:MAG: IclR family transcriptional regulator [Comamonadaceae bacterium]